MFKIPPVVKNSFYSGLTFFSTVVILSITFATIGSTWTSPSTLEVGAWSGLTANSWNKLLANFNNLDTRISTLSSWSGLVAYGGSYLIRGGNGAGCAQANVVTGACSCPTGYSVRQISQGAYYYSAPWDTYFNWYSCER